MLLAVELCRFRTMSATIAQMESSMIDTDDYNALQYNKDDLSLTLGRYPGIWHCCDHEVCVRVMYAGICDADLYILDGRYDGIKNPLVPGHEISGVVVKIGMLVKTVSLGERVAVNAQSDCFRCCSCNRTEPHFCVTSAKKTWLGFLKNGGWAEYCLVHEDQLFRLPRQVTPEQAVLCDPLSNVIHAWYKIAPVQRRKSILLFGGDIVGHLMASVLHVQGFRNVIIAESEHKRRKHLRDLVPGFMILEKVCIENKKKKDDKWGVDIVIDCDGDIDSVNLGLKILLPGGVLLLTKSLAEGVEIKLSPFDVYMRELKVIGSLMNPYNFPEVISWLETLGERYLDFKKLNIKTFDLKEYQEAIREYQLGKITKAVFKMDFPEGLIFMRNKKTSKSEESSLGSGESEERCYTLGAGGETDVGEGEEEDEFSERGDKGDATEEVTESPETYSQNVEDNATSDTETATEKGEAPEDDEDVEGGDLPEGGEVVEVGEEGETAEGGGTAPTESEPAEGGENIQEAEATENVENPENGKNPENPVESEE